MTCFRKKTTTCLALAGIAISLAIPACTVTRGRGTLTIRPYETPGPTRGVKTGTITLRGTVYCLLDMNNDGTPDLALDPTTGQLWRIDPVGAVPSAMPLAPGFEPRLADAHQIPPRDGTGPVAGVGDYGDHIVWSGIDDEVFDFGTATAEEWIGSVGLDVDAGVESDTAALQLGLFDTTDSYTETTLFWRTDFGRPSVLDFDLDYEMYLLETAIPDNPDFLVFRLAGDVREVIRFALAMGGSRFAFDHDGSTWEVVAHADDMTADLYRDGVWQLAVALDD